VSRKKKSEQGEPVALADAIGTPTPDRMVDGVPVRTYRGASLAELAPRIRAELGDSAMILRQREGVTGGIAGFFAKRMVEVDVAVLQLPGSGRIDVSDGPSVGPQGGGQSLFPHGDPAAQAAPTAPTAPAQLPQQAAAPSGYPANAQPTASAYPMQPTVPFEALRPPLRSDQPENGPVEAVSAMRPSYAPGTEDDIPHRDDEPAEPPVQPTVPFSAVAEQHGLPTTEHPDNVPPTPARPAPEPFVPPAGPAPGANPYEAVPPSALTPPHQFSVGAPSAQESAGLEAALAADQARERLERQQAHADRVAAQQPPTPQPPAVQEPPVAQPAPASPAFPPAHPAPIEPEIRHATPPVTPPAPTPTGHDTSDASFDAGRSGAEAAPVAQSTTSFESRLAGAGLSGAAGADRSDPIAKLAPLHGTLLRKGLPDQIASPVVDDTLLHRVPLQPTRPVGELLASELARRIPTAPLAGRSGQAVAFVGSSGAGKTRAIARLAAAYGAANQVPVACVTLQESGNDGLLATALAPFGIAVHAAPDAPRALDRITALRRHALVLVDTPGVSPGDREAVERLGSTLQLLELDQVALCLPVVLAAPIARRVLRAMKPLGPTVLVATHADEADLLGGVVAVAIDRRVPIAYVSAGAGRGSIVGADAHQIAAGLAGVEASFAPERAKPLVPRPPAHDPSPAREAEPVQQGPTVDVAAGPEHLAAPWIVSSLRGTKRRP
jgi:flagellar biosynthesis GTPase FlhF